MVLAGRHLVGIFFLLVIVLGVVFTLGYLLGRNQYDTQLRAAVAGDVPAQGSAQSKAAPLGKAASSGRPDPPAGRRDIVASTPLADADWEFYRSAEPAKPVPTLSRQAQPKPSEVVSVAGRPAAPPPKPVARTGSNDAGAAKSLSAPLIPRGTTVLQVAALMHEADALALAQALQQKKFPAFVLTPDTDHFYRVQVGPYKDASSTNDARKRLEAQGFKSIVKR